MTKTLLLFTAKVDHILYLSLRMAKECLFFFDYPKDEKTTLEVLNDWNKSIRYFFAYLHTTEKNNEVFILDNLTVSGVTEERIKSFFVLHGDDRGYFSRYLSELEIYC